MTNQSPNNQDSTTHVQRMEHQIYPLLSQTRVPTTEDSTTHIQRMEHQIYPLLSPPAQNRAGNGSSPIKLLHTWSAPG